MRIIKTMALVAAVFATLVPASPARAAEGDVQIQTYLGNVILPTRYPDTEGDISGGFPGLGRRLWLAWAGGTQNVVADVFPVDPATWGGRFELEPNGDVTGLADLGIFFYDDFGSLAAVLVGDPGGPVAVGEYDEFGTEGEMGAIPEHSTYALVFMKTGLDARFTYRGFAPPTVEITADGFGDPIEILAGQKVVWVNTDTAFHGVRSDATNDFGRLFDSSPNHPNQPIGQGSTFSHTFFGAGEYPYHDHYTDATGLVTVTGEFGTPA